MISKSILSLLDMEDITDYFHEIIETHGKDLDRARELFGHLSEKQKRHFFEWFSTAYYYEMLDNKDNDEPVDVCVGCDWVAVDNDSSYLGNEMCRKCGAKRYS
jgi:Mg/Co/Ni transporter MgtE